MAVSYDTTQKLMAGFRVGNEVSLLQEVMDMKHRHEYEAVYHPGLSSAAKTLGIKAAEMRKCKT
jgi:hypothetical protein